MPETEKYTRTTISVPPALKEQMEAVETSVNWSALACRAFEEKLAELAAHKEKKDMRDIVTRLRASRRQAEDAQYKAGAEAGREWVEDTAEADELVRLERWKTAAKWEWDHIFGGDPNRNYSAAEQVAFVIWPEHDGNYTMSQVFWERALGDGASGMEDPNT